MSKSAAFIVALASLALPVAAATGQCVGDCDGGGTVTIDELVTGVDIASAGGALASCPASDGDDDEDVDIDELLNAVGFALRGCPGGLPTPTPTVGSGEAAVGTWSGTGVDATSGVPRQVRIRVELAAAGALLVTDLGGNLFDGRDITVAPLSPSAWIYTMTTSILAETLNISVLANGDLAGTYSITTLTFPPVARSIPFTLRKGS